jgi:pyruvate dehydrogenase E2 component (dihydrolipoamide acetyltransferase)
MISEIIIPDLGATGGDVTIQKWLVQTGDIVKSGQVLYELATDKAIVEVESFRDGIIQAILVPQGETVALGTTIGLIADSIGEEQKLLEDEPQLGLTQPEQRKPETITKVRAERILASPLARRIANEKNINLEVITGSGSKGQILKRDVLAALKGGNSLGSPKRLSPIPLSPMRRSIADRTSLSKSTIPHFYADTTIDMHAAIDLRRQMLESAELYGDAKPTITDLCIRATALTLREFPSLNARFDGETIILAKDINIGIVIGLPEGLLIPVIQGADQLDLYSLASKTQQVRQRAQAGQLISRDMGGGTFTLSNLGMFDVDSFTAVINPPEVGILALGKIKEQATVIEGKILPHPLMVATLSVDHRVIDGIIAARFLSGFKNILENPFRLTFEASQDTPQ